MANTEYRIPGFKKSTWLRLIEFIDWLEFGNQKWTEKVIDWLVKTKKPCIKIGNVTVLFDQI